MENDQDVFCTSKSHKMEKEGLVSSLWEEGGQGQRRRVYEITESGKRNLKQWIKILENQKIKNRKVNTEV